MIAADPAFALFVFGVLCGFVVAIVIVFALLAAMSAGARPSFLAKKEVAR